MIFISFCLLLLLVAFASASTDINNPENWIHPHQTSDKFISLIHRKARSLSENQELSFDEQHRHSTQARRRVSTEPSSSVDSWSEEIRGGVGGVGSFPQRVRIVPFELLLAPTPVQFERGDEDLLLEDVQELVGLYIKAQFGDEGTTTNSMGVKTKLEYVLLSDIDESSWSKGNDGLESQYRSILRFNGGVASFTGPEAPPEDLVNEWVEGAINRLLVSALDGTDYDFIQHAQYFKVNDPNMDIKPEDVILDFEEEASEPPLLINQAQASQAARDEQQIYSVGRNDIPLTTLLASILAGFGVVIVILVFFIHRNNRAVRILSVDSRENGENIEHGNQAPASIRRETTKIANSKNYRDQHDTSDIVQQRNTNADDLKWDISLASQCAIDEASLQESITLASNFTIPTVSAASLGSTGNLNEVSLQNPNLFSKNLLHQESFQKERKKHLTKDMMFSKWSGKEPNLDSLYRNRRDKSVLKPSYFSAAKELEGCMSKGAIVEQGSDDSSKSSGERDCESREQSFRVEQAHENGSALANGKNAMPLSSSRPRLKQKITEASGGIV